jgi:hypothetical protein
MCNPRDCNLRDWWLVAVAGYFKSRLSSLNFNHAHKAL